MTQPALDGGGNPVAGRRLTYDYDTANGVDLINVRQTTGTNNETVLQLANYTQHKPQTVTDAAGQVATYTYNSAGQVLTETRTRNGNQETTTWAYDTNGYLMSITGPLPGATVSFTYDDYGRSTRPRILRITR